MTFGFQPWVSIHVYIFFKQRNDALYEKNAGRRKYLSQQTQRAPERRWRPSYLFRRRNGYYCSVPPRNGGQSNIPPPLPPHARWCCLSALPRIISDNPQVACGFSDGTALLLQGDLARSPLLPPPAPLLIQPGEENPSAVTALHFSKGQRRKGGGSSSTPPQVCWRFFFFFFIFA